MWGWKVGFPIRASADAIPTALEAVVPCSPACLLGRAVVASCGWKGEGRVPASDLGGRPLSWHGGRQSWQM